jgi:ferredoxin
MDELRTRAKELLENHEVQLVIGFENGTGNKTRAAFIDNPNEVDKLVFDSRCVQNIALYLTKHEIRQKGKPAIVSPLPVLRTIIQLASEQQIKDGDIEIIGISPESKIMNFATLADIDKYLEYYQLTVGEKEKETLAKISNMTREERFKYWIDQLSPCFKCYACRQACPLCYCPRCTVEQNQPQWIPVPSHEIGNLEWHIMRAMHLAGRCTDCAACANACPLGIPLNFLTRHLIEDIETNFGKGSASPTLKQGNILSVFKPEDKDNFIL